VYSDIPGVCATVARFSSATLFDPVLGTWGRERLATSALYGFVILVLGCSLFDISYFVAVLHCYLFKSNKAHEAFIITRALD